MQGINIITQIILPISLAFIMFALGLELTILDFKRVVKQPQAFIVGAIGQILLLPLVAFGLLSVWQLDPALAVGVMIIAACPGGVTSNLLTYLARGDSALSVSLTAIISLLCVFTLPLIIGLSIDYFMGIAMAPKFSIGELFLGCLLLLLYRLLLECLLKKPCRVSR